MNLKFPPVTFDWTINLTHIITTLMFVFTAIAGYYDLKSDVRNIETVANAEYKKYDEALASQKIVDAAQDARVAITNQQIRDQMRDSSNDIKQDIRDLRQDIFTYSANKTLTRKVY